LLYSPKLTDTTHPPSSTIGIIFYNLYTLTILVKIMVIVLIIQKPLKITKQNYWMHWC